MSADVLRFDTSSLNIADETAVDHDVILHQELKQLIAEQFEDFDFGDDLDDEYKSNNSDLVVAHQHTTKSNPEDLTSILAAGKLSLLENAIQRFGEEETRMSGEIETEHSGSESLPDRNGSPRVSNSDATKMPLTQAAVQSDLLCMIRSDNCALIGNDVGVNQNNVRDEAYCSVSTFGQTETLTNCTVGHLRDAPPNGRGSSTASVAVQRDSFGLSDARGNDDDRTTRADERYFVVARHDSDLVSSSVQSITDAVHITGPVNTLPHLSVEGDSRRELLYAARGRQLGELQAELTRVREEIAKEKRLANHRLTLAEGERQSLISKVTSANNLIHNLQQELNEKLDCLAKLQQRLAELERSNVDLTTELTELRCTNESLSAQLVELTTGDAVRRVEQREGKLAEALERRHAVAAEDLKADLQLAHRRLSDKESEIVELQRQLDTCKADAKKARSEFNDTIMRTNKQLEEAQQHCQKLASSALCSEVASLRHKVCELETSRKITEDVNKILQEELHDLREQVFMYENILKLDGLCNEDHGLNVSVFSEGSPVPEQPVPTTHKRPKSVDHVVTFMDEVTVCQPSGKIRPASALGKSNFSVSEYRRTEEFGHLFAASDLVEQPTVRHTAVSEPIPKSCSRNLSDCESDQFHSISRRGALTSTPAPSAVLRRLRSELVRCLSRYKIKQEQVTKLHEVVFTTRCQLHQSVENAERWERTSNELKDRLLTLERELSGLRDLNDTPGPRENVLNGQLERMKADYSRLEEELQATRTRLQSALGAEARALENEKTATERLAASTAERDAAVERARAVCEAHYTAMRRHLEMDWASEREAAARHADEMLTKLRLECAARDKELHRVNQLYQEARLATQHAVESALAETMQEREAERMRFWREELPNQLNTARLAWDQEWSERCAAAVRQVTDTCERKFAMDHGSLHKPDTACCDSQTCFPVTTSNASVCTELASLPSKDVQTDIGCILSLCGLLPDNSPGDVPLDNRLDLRLLSNVFGDYSVQCLQIQLLNSPALSLVRLEKLLRTFVSQRLKSYRQRTWNVVANRISQLLDTYHLNDLLQSPTEMYLPSVNVSLAARVSQSLPYPLPVNTVDIESGAESDIDQSEDQFTRSGIEHRLIQLVVALSELQMKLNSTREKLKAAERLSEQTAIAENTTKIYQSTISRIKQEVMTYVQTCQTRAAQTLHSELARVHRRACRQFTAHLRRALCEAGAPLTPFSASSSSMPNPRVVFPSRRQSNSLLQPTFSTNCRTPPSTSSDNKQMKVGSESDIGDYGPGLLSPVSREPPALSTDLESLLHVIDNVCASAESQFQAGFSTGSAMFERSDKNTPLATKSLASSPSHTLPTVVVSTETSSIPSFFGGPKCNSRHDAANDSQLSSPHTELLPLKWLHKRSSQPEGISPAHKLVRDCTSVSSVPLLNITLAHPVHTCHLVSRSQSVTDNTRLSSTHQSVASTTISPHIPQACVTVHRGPNWETIGQPLPPPRHLRTILSGDSLNVLTTTAVITQTINTSAALPRHTGQSNAAVFSQTLSHLNPRCGRRQFLYPTLSSVGLPLPVRKRASQ